MDDQGKKQVALLCDQSPTYAAGYAAGIEIGREAGMREAAKLYSELTRGYYDHARAPYERYRDAILSAIGGGK